MDNDPLGCGGLSDSAIYQTTHQTCKHLLEGKLEKMLFYGQKISWRGTMQNCGREQDKEREEKNMVEGGHPINEMQP